MINSAVMRKETMISKKRKAMAARWEDVISMGKRRNDSSHIIIYHIYGNKIHEKNIFFYSWGKKLHNTVLSNPTLETEATVDSSSSASSPNDNRLKFLSKAMIC